MTILTVNSQDLGRAATIDTYGMFDGGSIDDALIEWYNEEHNTDYNYDDFEWEYDHENIVKDLAKKRAEYLENDVDIIHSVKVLSTGSPREYNFSTDYAMFEIDYDKDAVDVYIYDHAEDWSEWYKNSGWYSTIEWRDDGDYKNELLEMARLNFYLDKWYDSSEWRDYDPLYEDENDIYYEHTTYKLKQGDDNEIR